MGYDLEKRLVVGIASSALFDLAESDGVFRREGEEAYRRYQEEHLATPLRPGMAFPFVRRLLSLNDISPEDPLVEVIVLSQNDPDTGLRVLRSVEHHGLGITRAVFNQGRAPYRFMPALNMSLFLSANESDVRAAVAAKLPAGRVLDSAFTDDPADPELRVAFDFDGILADDASDQVWQREGLPAFQGHEVANMVTPHEPGPLRDFLAGLNRIQRREEQQGLDYRRRLRISIVTARGAPAHERAVTSLKRWGVMVNDAFFLGGVGKAGVLDVLRPHIFFDDQPHNLAGLHVPGVHVPFGVINEQAG
ncbi:5'-nucleotidase [Kutzneria chonburiensis]|uniref:5'-nucleotidase n=1 Tax=Kutzneria chonburiensis TaxID=1483604 RepID=A0ABV6MSK8_9PSEU|nr:5'-nucleotidase [Kutzneria chonburiensis]